LNLLIVAHTPHGRRDGRYVGWGPTIVEYDHLAQLFDHVRIIAFLHPGPAPASYLPYSAPNVTLIPVPPAGGDSLREKLDIIRMFPLYARTILAELRTADVAHIRCPANISFLALAILAVVKKPARRWAKYAGNWKPEAADRWSYRAQRWMLSRGWLRGVVTINGRWPAQPSYVHSFYNPCLTAAELVAARVLTRDKELTMPPRLLFVGALNAAKGVDRALRVMADLHARGLPARLELVGDGPDRPAYEKMAREIGLGEAITFHGWLPHEALGPIYAGSHFMLFPSSSEGWPKVLSEGMAYGAVPVASRVGSIPQYLEEFGAGRTFPPDDTAAFANAIRSYCDRPSSWAEESEKGKAATHLFSYSYYLEQVARLLREA